MKLLIIEHPVVLDREPLLPESLRGELAAIVSERRRIADLRRSGLSPTRSALFVGPPGVGKTLCARWLARELGVPLLILDLTSVMSSFLGRTGVNMRHVLDYARGIDCVLLFDEFDAIAKRRDDSTEIGELKRLVTVLLQEVDSWPDVGLLIAATNHPELLDRAIWRRFDAVLHFENATEDQVSAAIEGLLPELARDDRYFGAMRFIYAGHGLSYLERDLNRVRRQSIISSLPIKDLVKASVATKIRDESHATRIQIAHRLVRAGFSQREAHDLSGVSRDTLRKALD